MQTYSHVDIYKYSHMSIQAHSYVDIHYCRHVDIFRYIQIYSDIFRYTDMYIGFTLLFITLTKDCRLHTVSYIYIKLDTRLKTTDSKYKFV